MILLNVHPMQNQQGAYLIFSVILCNAKRLFLPKTKKRTPTGERQTSANSRK